MCTSIAFNGASGALYFGRNLDWESGFGEVPVFAPRNWSCTWAFNGELANNTAAPAQETQDASTRSDAPHAVLGIEIAAQDTPLYFDCMNEAGLAMGGLLFAGFAQYEAEPVNGKINIASYEFPLWVTRNFSTVDQVLEVLNKVAIIGAPIAGMDPTPLHWMIADKEEAITVESVKEGLKVYDNPAGVMTNNPPFDQQMHNLSNFMNLSPKSPENRFSSKLPLSCYSRGMGALGLPGDLSSQSRFVRVAFVKMNSVSGDSEWESVSQFFHILGSVDQQKGCCDVGDEKYEYTIYTSCCNASKGIYYYTTYDNHQINGVDMHRENLDSETLFRYPLILGEQIHIQN